MGRCVWDVPFMEIPFLRKYSYPFGVGGDYLRDTLNFKCIYHLLPGPLPRFCIARISRRPPFPGASSIAIRSLHRVKACSGRTPGDGTPSVRITVEPLSRVLDSIATHTIHILHKQLKSSTMPELFLSLYSPQDSPQLCSRPQPGGLRQ